MRSYSKSPNMARACALFLRGQPGARMGKGFAGTMVSTALIAIALALIFAVPNDAVAQSARASVTKYQYDRCMARPANYGGTALNIYVAWARGIAHTCLYSEYPPAQARAFVLKQCEKSLQRLRKNLKINAGCSIVIEQGRIADSAYRRALRSSQAVAVKVTVYDKDTNTTQPSSGTYADYPLKFKGPNPTEMGFELFAGSLKICTGKTSSRPLSLKVKFQATCFGNRFAGSARATKTIRHNDMLVVVPEKVRVTTRKGSWIEVRF